MVPMPTDVFAHRLRLERERQKLSQAELARRIAAELGTNVDPSAVTRIEQQTRAVRLDEAVAAAKALDVPLTMLISEDAGAHVRAQMQEYLEQLAVAHQAWEEQRQEVLRLTQAIQTLAEIDDRFEQRENLLKEIDRRSAED